MKLYCKNTNHGLIPLYNSDYDQKRKLKIGKDYLCEITMPRNYEFHKKFFALLNLFFENQSENYKINDFDTFREIKTMKAGYFKIIVTEKGTTYLPKSINFASMDNVEFEHFYSKMLDLVIKELNADENMINEMLIDFM